MPRRAALHPFISFTIMKTQTPKHHPLAYRLIKETSYGYNHLELEILAAEPWSHNGMFTLLTFRFQSDSANFGRWYGMHTKTNFDGHCIERLAQAGKLAKQLLAESLPDGAPRELIARLEARKIPRVMRHEIRAVRNQVKQPN